MIRVPVVHRVGMDDNAAQLRRLWGYDPVQDDRSDFTHLDQQEYTPVSEQQSISVPVSLRILVYLVIYDSG